MRRPKQAEAAQISSAARGVPPPLVVPAAALVADGIPAAQFAVDDVYATHRDLAEKGVKFTQPPTLMGPVVTAVLDDTCGNLIQIFQVMRPQ